MGHASIDNKTPYEFAALHLTNEDGRPIVVTVVRATFSIRRGGLALAEEQSPVPLGGEVWYPDADVSSWKHEPEIAFVKPSTDIVVLGSAYSVRGGTEVEVAAQVGTTMRAARVIGAPTATPRTACRSPQLRAACLAAATNPRQAPWPPQ